MSPSESKETPLKKPDPVNKSAIVSPATEDYIKEDVQMLDTNLKKFEKIQGPSQREQRLAILNQQKRDDSFGSGRHKSKTFASREKNTEQKPITKFEDQIEGKDRPLTAELLKKQSEDLKELPKHALLRDQKWMVSTFDVQQPSTNEVVEEKKSEINENSPDGHLSSNRLKSRERKDTIIKQLYKIEQD